MCDSTGLIDRYEVSYGVVLLSKSRRFTPGLIVSSEFKIENLNFNFVEDLRTKSDSCTASKLLRGKSFVV